MTRMPNFYVPPLGGPLNWGDEQSGELPFAVLAFMQYKKDIDPQRLELVRQYLDYYIHAPCWDANPHHDDETREALHLAREVIRNAKTYEEIHAFLHACLKMGIDPL